MTMPTVSPSQVRRALLLREEIAFLDLRHEAAYATGHPLFAANMATDRITLEAEARLPRRNVPIVFTTPEKDLFPRRQIALWRWDIPTSVNSTEGSRPGRWQALSCSRMLIPTPRPLANSSKSRRHTPSLSANEVAELIATEANIRISMFGGSMNMRP